MNLKQITPHLSVAPQLYPADLATLAAAGIKGIVNNRPDGEEPGQPSSDELQAAAARAALSYWHIPIVSGEATECDARDFAAALRAIDGPAVAFCRTGNRSAGLWKIAEPFARGADAKGA